MNPETQKMSSPEEMTRFGAWSSIRTRYALATALFLLLVLGVFYVGGRIVLVHLVRDAEQQVEEIGRDVQRVTIRRTEGVCGQVRAVVLTNADTSTGDEIWARAVRRVADGRAAFAVRFSPDGSFSNGVRHVNETVTVLDASQLKVYADCFATWTRSAGKKEKLSPSGLVCFGGQTFCTAVARLPDGGCLALGEPFDAVGFKTDVSEKVGGMDVRITNRRAEVKEVRRPQKRKESAVYGLGPILSEAASFYSGGFWEIGSDPHEAVFALRDIAGNAVSMINVALPRTFSAVTAVAMGRLAFFIAAAGIFLVLPVFWIQGRLLLNPLSKMTEAVRLLGEHHRDTDCPRLEWEGKDEFAVLAVSVNAMLETLSRRALAVAQVETRQKAMINGVPDGLAVFDVRGTLISVTKEPEGVDPVPGLVAGRGPDAEIWGPENMKRFAEARAAVFERKSIGRAYLRFDADGKRRRFEMRLTRLDGFFALAVFRDVTAEADEHRRRVDAEARLSEQRRQDSLTVLAAGIAHDVNNVLAAVLNTAELTWMDTQDEVEQYALDTIRDAVRRGSTMARELMTFAGETRLTVKRTDPSSILRDGQRLVRGIIGENAAIAYDLPTGLPAVDVDPNQIWKVFFNLIKNASEALDGRPGSISVSTEAFEMTEEELAAFHHVSPLSAGRGVLFRIADTGRGIPPENLRRVFDPYFSTKAMGRGFGLATVSAIVDAHGGAIAVDSQVERGTVFRIYLPASKTADPSEAAPVASAVPTPAIGASAGNGRVLFVDNDPLVLKTTAMLLKTLNVSLVSATTRLEGLAVFRRCHRELTLVLLDAHLGALDTVRLLAAFRAIDPVVPVVVCSGSSPERMKEKFASHPFNDFLAKPFTLVELRAAYEKNARKI